MSNQILKVGVGRSAIKFPEHFFPIENFSGIHDELHIRVFIIKTDISFVIVSCELTSLQSYEIENLKEMIAKETHIAHQNIWICVTHTFSSPHTRSLSALKTASQDILEKNKTFCQRLEKHTMDALKIALESLQTAYIGFGNGYCSVNVNRDVYTNAGWWLGANDLGFSDKSIPIIRFDDIYGQPIALLYSCDVQSSIMDDSLLKEGGRLVTGDLTGIASQYIEEQYGGDFVAMYIVGAAGDQAPMFQSKHYIVDHLGYQHVEDIHEEGFVFVNALGKKLGNQVVSANEKIKSICLSEQMNIYQLTLSYDGQKIISNKSDIVPTHHYQFQSETPQKTNIYIMNIGEIVLIGVEPELSSLTAMTLKKMSPFPLTMVFTMVNGGAKYMPDETAYDRITYEAMNSHFARGSAEKLINDITSYLKQWKDK